MGRLGFEPRTNRLKAEYSTVELATPENNGLNHFFPRMIIIAQVFYKNPSFPKLNSFFSDLSLFSALEIANYNTVDRLVVSLLAASLLVGVSPTKIRKLDGDSLDLLRLRD